MDDIPIELWKAAGEEGVDILRRIYASLYGQKGNGRNIGAG